jgi:ribosome-binding protein aMBF1 (putative translation factor)
MTIKGRRFVLVPEDVYKELAEGGLPPFPEADAEGNCPAVEYITVSIAREVILRRRALAWSQAELAKRAGLRVATVRRLELAKRDSSVRTVDKIDDALRAGERKAGIEPPDSTS